MATRLRHITLQGSGGLNYVSDSRLAFANVITVKRGGMRQHQVTAIPSGLVNDVYHNPATGKIYWSTERKFNEAEFDEFGARIIEIVHVIYTGGGTEIVDIPPVQMPPPTEEEPPVITGNGVINNNTYPLTGNEVNAVTYDGVAVTLGTNPDFDPASFPVEATPGSSSRLFRVSNPGTNKQLKVTVTTTSNRQLVIIDSIGSAQYVNDVTTGIHTINNVTIIGTEECSIIMN